MASFVVSVDLPTLIFHVAEICSAHKTEVASRPEIRDNLVFILNKYPRHRLLQEYLFVLLGSYCLRDMKRVALGQHPESFSEHCTAEWAEIILNLPQQPAHSSALQTLGHIMRSTEHWIKS
jgi:hypothetical protein